MLAGLSTFPGISEGALRLLELHGVAAPGPDAASRRALWISDAARREDSGDWARARDMLLADPDVLEGALALLEAEPSGMAAEFLKSLLSEPLSREQDHRIRKSLYRLKQLGVAAQPRQQAGSVTEKEWWALGENREPNLQFALCFRFHSAFASSGDLYVLRIWEGREAFPVEQEAGLQMGRSAFLELCKRYSTHISRQAGVDVFMQPAPAGHAHYFIRKSLTLLPETSDPRPLLDFLRFLGAGEGEDPFAALRSAPDSADVALMQHPYFQRWALDPEDLREYFEELKRLDEGPIILVGAPQIEQKRRAASEALARHFVERRRRLWAFAFHKAAYFLRKADQDAAARAMRLATTLENFTVEADGLDAAKILFERAIQLHAKMEEQRQAESKETSLIVTPDEFARSQRRGPAR
jgi:hypothetical protein